MNRLAAAGVFSCLALGFSAAQVGAQTFRTPWGDPDLQGTWTNTTTTPMQRPEELAGRDRLTAEERAELGEFMRALFASRRKKLRSGLREAERRLGRSFPASEAWCEQRPEELGPDELLSIWQGSRGGA